MTYSNDLRKKIIDCIHSRKYTNVEIINIFKINRKTFYKIKNESSSGSKCAKKQNVRKRATKITNKLRSYIRSYVVSNINFDYKKLIGLIHKKFNTTISKSSIYKILSDSKIKKKKIICRQTSTCPKNLHSKIILFNKQVKNAIKKSSMDNIISIDESSIDTHIEHDKGWSKYGSKVTKIKNYSRIRYSLILAISNKKIIHYQIVKGSVNGEIFLRFFIDLNKKLSNEDKYHFILDNAKIHHYKKLTKYINKHS